MLLPTKKRSNLVYPILAIIVAIIGSVGSYMVYGMVDESGRQHILDRANTIATALPLEQFKELSGTDADLSSPAYARLKALLIAEREVNRDVRFIYLLGKQEGGPLFFYMDSEDPASPDYSPPGQEYPEATEAMHAFFENGESSSEGPDRDRWGVWISAYAPLTDEEGNVRAMVGIDLPADRFLIDAYIYSSIPLLVALILILLILVASETYKREQERIDQKEEFLSIASHEIRTPITGIKWGLETLMRREGLSKEDTHLFSLMHENAQSLLGRLNNLLDVTALEVKGKKGLSHDRVEVGRIIRDVMQTLKLAAAERSVTLVPPETGNASFIADEQMMHHVFFNLIGNAVKYTKEGTDVRVEYRRDGANHVVSIRDHGEGIAPEDLKRIFVGYTRTESAKHSGATGTGLGLFLTKKAVELHGGTIAVESKKGEGTTFVVTIPA